MRARLASLLLALSLSACAPSPGTIGAVLGQRTDGRVFLREVPEGLAASNAGLREGDELLLIEGRDVRQMTSEQIHRALEGELGQQVNLTLLRGERVVRVTLTRTDPPKKKPAAPPPAAP